METTLNTPRLDPSWLGPLARVPRSGWGALTSELARTWLAMHESLRHGQRELERLGQRWQARQIDWMGFRREALPLLTAHLGHLHGHHRLEDQHYFPALRRADPNLARGFDLLAADHQQLDALLRSLDGLHRQLANANPAEAAAWQCAHDLVREAQALGPVMLRHLHDEEDLVIPLLALHDQRQAA